MNKNFLTLLAITAVAPFAIAAAPLEQFRSVTSVQQQSAQLAATTNAKITTMSEQINGALATQSSALANAIRGAVAQEAVSATQIATADRNARVVQAEAKNASDVAQKLLDIKLKYGPQTGQGYAACKTLIENQQTDQAVTNATLNTKDRVVTTDNAAGRFSSSLQDFAANAITITIPTSVPKKNMTKSCVMKYQTCQGLIPMRRYYFHQPKLEPKSLLQKPLFAKIS